ncbi:rho operon leader peptide [Salmonella enterica]|nr:rho operon leader peptide [Salmonella enterica]
MPGSWLIPSCRFSSAYFPVTRQRTDMS